MSKVVLGAIAGVIFGALDVGLMLPMSFPDKTTALLGAFTSRFAIGFVIGCVQLPGCPGWLGGTAFGVLICLVLCLFPFAGVPGWLVGLFFGLLISLPDAIITQKYVPILVLGGIGGLIFCGLLPGGRTAPLPPA